MYFSCKFHSCMWPVIYLIASISMIAIEGHAQERTITISAPQEMQENGFLTFLLPRFKLKHGVRVHVTTPNTKADVVLAQDGAVDIFSKDAVTYRLAWQDSNPQARKFADWLRSDIGLRTVLSFKIDGKPPYSKATEVLVTTPQVSLAGNVARGREASLRACGRCHVVGEVNRMNGIGSTPSFAVLRTLTDWQEKFETFYILNPHPSFTIVLDVTLPFDAARPPPIVPIKVTLNELEDIVAFVAAMAPANLGAPIQHQ